MMAHTKQARTSRSARGIQLLDFAVAAILVGVVAAAIMVLISNARRDRITSQAIQDIGMLRAAVIQISGTTVGYSSITNTVLINTKMIPNKMVTGFNITGPFAGAVNVTGTASYYEISYANVPSSACLALARSNFGRGMLAFSVTHNGTDRLSLIPGPATVDQSVAACDNGNGSGTIDLMTWRFR
jgi:hypothetical protein